MTHVAVVEIDEAWHPAIVTALDPLAGNEHRTGSPMICTQIGVLRDPSSEFAECHHAHVIGATDAVHVV